MKNEHVIEIIVEGKDWQQCLDKAFKKASKNTKVDGFRKGAVPKDIYLKKFGIESLYNEAAINALESNYDKISESGYTPVIEPAVDIKDINEEKVSFEIKIIEKPEVKLGDYKNLKVKKEKISISKDEIAKEIDRLRDQYAEISIKEKGSIELKDTAVINFKGYVDGKELEGGSGENYPLEIGSNTFIPGFEDGLVGLSVGDKKTLELTFPENYTKDLANTPVKFDIEIIEIKTRILPEMNKDFFMDLGYEEVLTSDELEKEIKKELEHTKEHETNDAYIDACLEKAASNMKVEINEEIIDDEVHRMIHQFEDQLKAQGLTLDQYSQFTGIDHHGLHDKFADEATKRVKYRYMLDAIAEIEKIDFTDEEADKKADEMAENYGITKDELIEAYGGMDVIKYDMKMREAIEIIKGE